MAKEKAERKVMNLAQTMDDLAKCGISVGNLSNKKDKASRVVSTGSLTLDIATGIGGYPRGRLVEVFGPESGGKTTLCLIGMAQVQKNGGRVAFVDAEHALDADWAKKLGVNLDPDKFLYIKTKTAESAFNSIIKLINTNEVDMIVVDSVAALTPAAEIEGEMEDANMALQARIIGRGIRVITSIADETNTTIVFINQLRDTMAMYGPKESTPGGRSLKFFSSMRFRVSMVPKSEVLNKRGDRVAHKINVKLIKNKCAAPFREAEFLLNFEKGIDSNSELFDGGVSKGLILRKGSTYSFKTWSAVGREKMEELIQSTEEMRKALIEAIEAAPVVPEVVSDEGDGSEDEIELDTAGAKKKGKRKIYASDEE